MKSKFTDLESEKLALKLNAQAERMEHVLDGAGLGSWDWWFSDNRVFFDRRWFSMLGLSFEGGIHNFKTWEDRVHPDDLVRSHGLIQDYLNGKSDLYENVHRLRHAKGYYVWILARGRFSEFDEIGKPTRFTGTHLDITEFREAEEKSRSLYLETSKELEQYFDLSPDLLIIAGFDATLKKVNGAFTSILGYSEGEIVGRVFLELIHPEDIASTLDAMSGLSRGEKVTNFENRYRCKDGRYRIMSWSASPDVNRGLIYAAARDITEQRAQQSELRQVMQAINSGLLVSVSDKSGKIISVNENLCKLTGFTESELVGKCQSTLLSPDNMQPTFLEIINQITDKSIWSGEIVNRSKPGEEIYMQAIIAPLLNFHGSIDRYLAIKFDTSRARKSENLLEEAQRVAKIGSWSFSIESREIVWSKQMFDIFPERFEDGPPTYERHFMTIHEDDRDLWKRNVELAIQEGTSYKMRFRTVSKDGTLVWIEAYGQAIRNKDQKITSLNGTCQDISDLVSAEELAHQERAKSIQSAKLASLGEMSAGIAHEINNPLTIISGMTLLLPKSVHDPIQLEKKINAISKACLRIAKIVNGLRKFSRSSEAHAKEMTSLCEIIEDALVMVGSKAKNKVVAVEVDCVKDLMIYCNSLEIEQVIINLLSNGIDAVNAMESKWVHVKAFRDPSDRVAIQVIDSGRGISDDLKSKLFQPFFTTKGVGEGTGLGLSISKGILDEHGATLEVKLEEGHTCFEIVFPKQ
ncbi:MAG: PAS domain-containing protein [Proteobacteria bacterium]|nr:PAS domain-containing protein [Pseudomonadota bacterium]